MNCKTCNKNFHTCSSCSLQGHERDYCSEECWKKSEEKSQLDYFVSTWTKEQIELYFKYEFCEEDLDSTLWSRKQELENQNNE